MVGPASTLDHGLWLGTTSHTSGVATPGLFAFVGCERGFILATIIVRKIKVNELVCSGTCTFNDNYNNQKNEWLWGRHRNKSRKILVIRNTKILPSCWSFYFHGLSRGKTIDGDHSIADVFVRSANMHVYEEKGEKK